MLVFSKKEIALVKKLNTPAKVQDFLNTIPFNFEKNGTHTIKSPVRVLRQNNAHCMEGALLGAYILGQHGYKPFVLHLQALKTDYDHIIVPFKQNQHWGALSKTNHAVLRYREPVYETIRELVMSYFHEYFTHDGKKTLRKYSVPLNLNIFGKNWPAAVHDLWEVDEKLDAVKHFEIVPKKLQGKLRKADEIERKAGRIVEFKK